MKTTGENEITIVSLDLSYTQIVPSVRIMQTQIPDQVLYLHACVYIRNDIIHRIFHSKEMKFFIEKNICSFLHCTINTTQ